MSSDSDFNPYRLPGETQRCPYGLYAEMRARDGLYRSDEFGGFYAVSRYGDVALVLQDGDNFGVSEGVSLMGPASFILPETDGALHRRYRRTINPWFRRGAIEALESDVRAVTKALLGRLDGRDQVEFIAEVCRPVVAQVSSKVVLTVGDEHLDELNELIALYTYDPNRAHEAIEAMQRFAAADIARRRTEPPRGDALDAVIQDESPDALTDREAQQVFLSLLIGAFDTTANTLAIAFAYLAQHHQVRSHLRTDRSGIPRAIEEFMRWDPTAQGMARTVRTEIEVGGQRLHPGDRLFVCTAAANHDETQFADPDQVDLDRTPNRHFGFGAGPHRCVGIHLANLVMRVCIEEVLERWPDLSLVAGTELRYKTAQMRAMVALPVVLSQPEKCAPTTFQAKNADTDATSSPQLAGVPEFVNLNEAPLNGNC